MESDWVIGMLDFYTMWLGWAVSSPGYVFLGSSNSKKSSIFCSALYDTRSVILSHSCSASRFSSWASGSAVTSFWDLTTSR
ncbi:hypothetical protein DPMN_121221 [Dreissena polymorpha]|uniref:Uncharacterized protein n=1 Tax=Dreissena polymorpha TaxID=45954 RepID=A0A9D4JQW6_DREPO|nr:hypothetical protein DPMN_121221 [Dreissena polymorpha]